MNSICLIGNICNDVELKVTPTGKSVCSFTLAVHRPYTKDTTDFFNVVCWGKQAESVGQHCKKGTRIGVSGMLTSRNYTDNNNQKRYVVEVEADEVTFTERKSAENNTVLSETAPAPYKNEMQFEEMTSDEDLPF